MNNWSDYPILLAVAETGSLTAAGNQLGISQPTVGRRIKALEAHFGAPLLTKEDGHLAPTEFGYLVLDHIRRMEAEADAITRSSATLEHSLIGPIMLAASQGIGDWWLPSVMQIFRQDHPEILIDINVDFRAVNLAQREADIALRWMGPGTQNSLIGRKVASAGFGLFASKEYISRKGIPQTPEQLLDHDAVRMVIGKENFWPHDENGETLPAPRATYRSNNLMSHSHAIQAGYGIGMMAFAAGFEQNGLVRVLPELERIEDLWVVAHEDLKKSARVRAAFDFIVVALKKDEAHFRYGKPSLYCQFDTPVLQTQSVHSVQTAPFPKQAKPAKLSSSAA